MVSAQKRNESLQDVPLSIQAIGQQQLAELKVDDFSDYVKFLPNVSYQTAGPGFSRPYMRGVASGENANHSGPLPSVGVYLDEQPITTITGPLDVQVYDIARVEVLAGPQGTLYGASSQAGTIRIITNKPDPDAFDAGFQVTGSTLEGDLGYVGQGFLNVPIGEKAAIRLVGWHKNEPGYIDNVLSTRVFPVSGIAVDNSDRVEDNYNDWTKTGARLALGNQPERYLDADAHGHGAEDQGQRHVRLRSAARVISRLRTRWPRAARTSGCRRHSPCRARSATGTSPTPARTSSAISTRRATIRTIRSSTTPAAVMASYAYDNDYTLIDPSQFITGSDRLQEAEP